MSSTVCILLALLPLAAADVDWRNIVAAPMMVANQYLDQPYCVTITDLRWLCAITANDLPEGHLGEHVSIFTTQDAGLTWSSGQRVEPESNLTNAYSAVLLTPFGRVYVLYSRNSDNVTAFPDKTPISRDDELGYLYQRYTDDAGATWSDRILIPLRTTAIDRMNEWNGTVHMFWNVDQIKTRVNATTGIARAYFAFTKIATYPQSPPEELWLLYSDNVMTERNASAVVWTLAPDGDHGIAPPNGATTQVGEEAHVIPLVGSSGLAMVFRTTQGFLGCAATPDADGNGWAPSNACEYGGEASGNAVKNPRGPITLKRYSRNVNDQPIYLLLFYFNSVQSFTSRDPYWLTVALETGSTPPLLFAQPEIVIYDFLNTQDRPGYPDMVMLSNGSVYITETNKTVARVHHIDDAWLQVLLQQPYANGTANGNVSHCFNASSQGATFPAPPIASFDPNQFTRGVGVTIALWLHSHGSARPGDVLLSTLDATGAGISVTVAAGGAVTLTVASSATLNATLTTDATCTAALLRGAAFLSLHVDGGAHVASATVNGRVCDGGVADVYGWTWLPPALCATQPCSGTGTFVLGGAAPHAYGGVIDGGNIWTRVLMHTEAVAQYRYGAPSVCSSSK